MAYKIIRPADHDAWLQEREKGIGSSEATTLMGVNHYEDRYRLYLRKTHQLPPKEATEQMELGHHLEPAVASRFAQLTGAWVDPKSEGDWIAADTKKDYLRVSPDRIWVPSGEEHTKANWRILECKTTGMSVDGDDIPSYWYCQLQYQMGVMGIKHGAVAWISSFPVFNSGYKEIDFNPGYYKLIVDAIDEFWNGNILKGVAPEPEDLEDLRVKYGTSQVTVKGESFVAEDWMQADYDELLGIKSQMDTLKDRKKELEDELEKAIMGYAAIYGKDGQTVLATRQPRTPKQELNKELLRQEYEDIYNRYLELQESVFNETLFKKECRELYNQYLITPEAGEPEFKVTYPRKTSSRKTTAIF